MSVIVKGMTIDKKDAQSCICTINMLRNLAYNTTGVLDWIDHENCDKIIEMLETLIELPPHGRLIDAEKLMMSLADWWYSSFGEEETDEAKAIRKVLDTVEQSIGEMTVVEAEGREE